MTTLARPMPPSLWTPAVVPPPITPGVVERRHFRLRRYQEDAIAAALDCYEVGENRIVIEIPTGGGKTITALSLLQKSMKETDHGLFLVPSIDLTEQTTQVARSLFRAEDVGRVQGEYKELGRHLTIASVQTLADEERRAELLASIGGRKFTYIIADEAHGAICDSYMKIVEDLLHPYGLLLGMTATPQRHDRKSLRRLFSSRSSPAFYVDILDLIAQKHLVRVQAYKVETDLNLNDLTVEIENEENREGEKELSGKLKGRLKRSNRYEKAYASWTQLIDRGRTIIFADSVGDAYGFRDYFLAKNALCAVITGKTPTEQRDELYTLFRSGDLPILIAFGCLTTGVDFPEVRGTIIGRFSLMGDNPNTGLHQQMVGRIMRPYPGKDHAVAVYLTSKRYPNVPYVMSMGLLPGTLEDSHTAHSSSPSRVKEETVKEEEIEGETLVEREQPGEEEDDELYIRLTTLKAQATDLFSGEGWVRHFDWSFTKETPYGTLTAEREGNVNTYSMFLVSSSGYRKRITDAPVEVKEALARGVQFVKREEVKARMRRGDTQVEGSHLPLDKRQMEHLKHRRGTSLPKLEGSKDIDFSQMTQGIYYQIEALLKQRDSTPREKGASLPIVIWKPGEKPRLWTPPQRKPATKK